MQYLSMCDFNLTYIEKEIKQIYLPVPSFCQEWTWFYLEPFFILGTTKQNNSSSICSLALSGYSSWRGFLLVSFKPLWLRWDTDPWDVWPQQNFFKKQDLKNSPETFLLHLIVQQQGGIKQNLTGQENKYCTSIDFFTSIYIYF